MPLPERLARFNRMVTNPLTRPFAARLPWFCVIRHRGRRTGTIYETPVNGWHSRGRVVVPLTYGSDVDWLRNALASGNCEIVMNGSTHLAGRPEPIPSDEGMDLMPGVVKVALAALGVTEFVAFPLLESGHERHPVI